MLFNESERRLDGAVITTKQAQCSRCATKIDFDIMHYVDSGSPASRLLPVIFHRRYYALDCQQCDNRLDADWFPLIVDVSDIGVIIFATPGIDDGTVDDGFRNYATHVVDYLDHERQARFYRSPYTVVYGAPGVAAMFEALGIIPPGSQSGSFGKGRNWRTRHIWGNADDVPQLWNAKPELLATSCDVEVSAETNQAVPIRILHAANPEFSVEPSDGYLYGDLFFFYPKQRFIQSLVHAFLKVTTGAPDEESRRLVYSLFGRGPFAETSHPWVLNELGRLALEGDPDGSSSLLQRSIDAQHTWLAVTANFLDATPRRREEDEVPAPQLTAAETRGLGRHVDSQRHTLLRQFPAEEDYGRWYFPFSEQCSISSAYSLEELGAIFGHSLRSFEVLFRDQDRLWTGAAQFWWTTAVSDALAAIESYEQFCSAFWREYLPVLSVPARETARAALTAAVTDRRQRAPSDDPVIELWTAAMRLL
jgi:hypothetical protein